MDEQVKIGSDKWTILQLRQSIESKDSQIKSLKEELRIQSLGRKLGGCPECADMKVAMYEHFKETFMVEPANKNLERFIQSQFDNLRREMLDNFVEINDRLDALDEEDEEDEDDTHTILKVIPNSTLPKNQEIYVNTDAWKKWVDVIKNDVAFEACDVPKASGASCKRCNEFNQYAEPGDYTCYTCRK